MHLDRSLGMLLGGDLALGGLLPRREHLRERGILEELVIDRGELGNLA